MRTGWRILPVHPRRLHLLSILAISNELYDVTVYHGNGDDHLAFIGLLVGAFIHFHSQRPGSRDTGIGAGEWRAGGHRAVGRFDGYGSTGCRRIVEKVCDVERVFSGGKGRVLGQPSTLLVDHGQPLIGAATGVRPYILQFSQIALRPC